MLGISYNQRIQSDDMPIKNFSCFRDSTTFGIHIDQDTAKHTFLQQQPISSNMPIKVQAEVFGERPSFESVHNFLATAMLVVSCNQRSVKPACKPTQSFLVTAMLGVSCNQCTAHFHFMESYCNSP
ncbi:hypothetical protein GOP47_0019250 [Adiantum capillus-veneris]|uniref:Uncharacterized protein n=1 Tax=Adiantum capillus-veneris TaxID=13818 RepID=A0A9D4ZBG5_ADICA|nr:hypothetical protein GOP47_0019250 [Adiantum capillus-veneris]